MVNNTLPGDYSSDVVLGGSEWVDWRTGRCLRRTFSHVACYFAVFSEDFDLLDDQGNIVGEDYFFCDGYLSSWYPRASRPLIRIRWEVPECLWSSDS